MAIDAMFKLEHGVEDVQKSKKAAPVLHQLQVILHACNK
jgi:coiled-coil domain-containing protein 130